MLKRATAAFVLGVVATVAVLAFFGTTNQKVMSTTNLAEANRDKMALAPLQGVDEAAADILSEESKTRGIVITFDPSRTKMVASVRIPKTDDWKKDWNSLLDALPEDDVAAAIYSFPFWEGPAAESSKPVLFTSRPKTVDFKEQYLAGYFLGPLIIATEGVHKVKSVEGENYFEMCRKLRIDDSNCELENQFHDCPFAGDDSEVNPCTQKDENGKAVCGGSFIEEEVDTGSISKACCTVIDEYCGADSERMGCRGDTLEMIVANCNAPMPEPEVTPLMEFYLTQVCAPICGVKKCVDFEEPGDTYVKCAGCTGDFKTSKCSPTQPGFMEYRCAGVSDDCVNSKNEVECAIFGDLCMWATHEVAADFETAQQPEDDGE